MSPSARTCSDARRRRPGTGRPSIALGLGFALTAIVTMTGPAGVANAAPRVPADPTVLFREDFENIGRGPNLLLTDYVGANGERYTADPAWVSRPACNGFIVDSTSVALPGDCNANRNGVQAFGNLRTFMRLLGMIGGTDPDRNSAVAAYTEANPGANKIEFRTVQQIPMPAPNRFLTFSVDSVAAGCGAVPPPALRFYLEDSQGNVTPISKNPINPCTGGRSLIFAQGGHFAADGSFLMKGNSLGIVMRNEYGSGRGNDAAFDNIQVLDVTPIVDKSFDPSTIGTRQTSTLTFTVTNTSEKSSKDGFSFTDHLPAGLVVAPSPNFSSTCNPATITAGGAAGDTSVAFRGSLASGQTSCTFKIDVTAANEGTYTNTTSDNLTDVVGLNRGENATLKVEDPRLTAVKQLTGTRIVDTDQFTMRIRQGTTVVNDPAGATTAGSGASITTGTGTTGTTQVTAGSTYTVDEVPTGTAVLARYDTSVTCQDAAGIQTGLPTDVQATQVSITPVLGAKITCTFTNTPLTPGIKLEKRVASITDSNGNGVTDVGDTINYEFLVTNTGIVALRALAVHDQLLAALGITITCPTDSFAPNQQVTCTAAPYPITQADLDAGNVHNVATATATDPAGEQVTSNRSERNVPLTPISQLKLVKTADRKTVSRPGQVITYHFLVSNHSNVTVRNLAIREVDFNGAGKLSPITCPATELAPGAQLTCRATYKTTPSDLKKRKLINTAVAVGRVPDGNKTKRIASAPSTAKVAIKPGSLPFTGAPDEGAAMLGGGLLATGTVLLFLARRRRTSG